MKEVCKRNAGFGFLDPWFDPFFDSKDAENFGALSMDTDIKEEGDNYLLEVELPGFEKKNVTVDLKDGYLTISAKANRSQDEKDKKGNFIHRERFSGAASRSYYVGDVKKEDIKAAYKDGVLSVTLPKQSVEEIEKKSSIAIS